jgi:predicted PurR-regulated permease PerM
MARSDRTEFVWRALIVAVIAIAAVITLWVLGTAARVFLVAFGGILLAITLRRFAANVARLPRMNEDLALAVVLALLAGIIALGAYLMAPRVGEQVDRLIESVPRSIENLENYLSNYGWARNILAEAREGMSSGGEVVARATGLASRGFGGIVDAVVILFVGLYGAIQPRLYLDATVRLVPPRRRERAAEVLAALETTLWRWLVGRLIGMLVIGILTSIGLLILSVPLAIPLGVLSALLAFIPYLGPILSAGFAMLLALTESPDLALYTGLLYVGVQTVESYLLTPLIERQAILLPPALTIIAQVLLGILFGGLGLVLASPIVATIMVLVKMLYLEDFLGESITLPGDGKDDGDG